MKFGEGTLLQNYRWTGYTLETAVFEGTLPEAGAAGVFAGNYFDGAEKACSILGGFDQTIAQSRQCQPGCGSVARRERRHRRDEPPIVRGAGHRRTQRRGSSACGFRDRSARPCWQPLLGLHRYYSS